VYSLSKHAKERADQRNLSEEEIAFIVENGRKRHRSGVIFYQMLRKNMPDELPGNHPFRRLDGTTIVVSPCGTNVVTLYRNPKAFKRDSSKQKHRRR